MHGRASARSYDDPLLDLTPEEDMIIDPLLPRMFRGYAAPSRVPIELKKRRGLIDIGFAVLDNLHYVAISVRKQYVRPIPIGVIGERTEECEIVLL